MEYTQPVASNLYDFVFSGAFYLRSTTKDKEHVEI